MCKVIPVVGMLLFLAAGQAFASEGCSHDCRKCHSITEAEVKRLVSQHQGGIKVLSFRMAPVKGLWEVIAEQNNKKGVFYIDFEKKHIIYGAITNAKGAENLTQNILEQSFKIKASELDLKNAIYLGSKTARLKNVVFSDPTCPHCAQLHKEIKKLLKRRSDIGFYIVMYPLKKYRADAYDKAKTVFCSPSVAILEQAYDGKPLQPATCDAKALDRNLSVGEKYGVTGTPTVAFPNGKIHFGFISDKELETMISNNM